MLCIKSWRMCGTIMKTITWFTSLNNNEPRVPSHCPNPVCGCTESDDKESIWWCALRCSFAYFDDRLDVNVYRYFGTSLTQNMHGISNPKGLCQYSDINVFFSEYHGKTQIFLLALASSLTVEIWLRSGQSLFNIMMNLGTRMHHFAMFRQPMEWLSLFMGARMIAYIDND